MLVAKSRPQHATSPAPHPDLAIAELAERQHGVVSRQQLLAAGVTDGMIRTRVATRRLYRRHEGVFSLSPHPGQLGLFMAARLASSGWVSDRSALALWDLRAQTSGPVHVTVRHGCGVRRRGIRCHVSRTLARADTAVVEGVPCTSWARTLVDMGGSLQPDEMGKIVERSIHLRLFDKSALDAALDRANRRRGTGHLRRLLEAINEPAPTRSELERRFLQLLRDDSLPSPITNGLVAGYEVDFHWPDARLIVETDGRTTHDNPFAFERDHQRDLELKLAGWDVIRITWRQLRDEAGRVAALLRAKLGRL